MQTGANYNSFQGYLTITRFIAFPGSVEWAWEQSYIMASCFCFVFLQSSQWGDRMDLSACTMWRMGIHCTRSPLGRLWPHCSGHSKLEGGKESLMILLLFLLFVLLLLLHLFPPPLSPLLPPSLAPPSAPPLLSLSLSLPPHPLSSSSFLLPPPLLPLLFHCYCVAAALY